MNLLNMRQQAPHIKPWNLAILIKEKRRMTVEVMSYPTCEGTAIVRLIPGDCRSMIEAQITSLQPRIIWKEILKAKIILPWNNLGCLAISCSDFYADMYFRPHFGGFSNYRGVRTWYSITRWKVLRRQEVL